MGSRVSVVMPVHNGQRFVGEAVASLLEQTYPDFEIILIDDGSTDRSLAILESLAVTDPRIRVHRRPENSGAIAARNAGTSMARGEFIAVMDSDDVSLPNRLEVQVRYLTDNPAVGVVGAQVQLIDGDGKRGEVKTFPMDPALVAWSLFFLNPLAHPAVMMRRSVVERARGYAAECIGGSEDFDLFSRAAAFTRLANVRETLVLYRRWGGNMTQTAWASQERDAGRIVQDTVRAIAGEDISEQMAAGLRGLSTGVYPQTPTEIRQLAELIGRLYDAFVGQPWLTAADRHDVTRDAGTKYWLLAALALRRSPSLAAHLGRAAIQTSPGSFGEFLAKAVRRATRLATD